MRISSFEAGLVVLAGLPLVVANTSRYVFPTKDFIANINPNSRPGPPPGAPTALKYAIYEFTSEAKTIKTFSWFPSDQNDIVKVSTVNLCTGESGATACNMITSNKGIISDEGTIDTPSGSAGTPATTPPSDSKVRRQNTSGGLQQQLPRLNVTRARGVGTIAVELQTLINYRGQTLFFEVEWPDNAGGRSYSRAFTVTLQNEPVRDPQRFSIDESAGPAPFIQDNPGNGNGANTASRTAPGPTSAPTNSISPTKGFDDGGEGGNSETSNTGLAPGAIAGIAIGGLAFLVFIVLVAWLLIRRRRKSNEEAAIGSYGHGRSRTDELMAEKEANAGIDAAPHSPYSDEGGNNSLHQVNPAVVPPVLSHHRDLSQQPLQLAHDAARSYTPYSDHPSGAVGSPKSHVASVAATDTAGRDGSPIPGRVTPHGMTQYAHLVEEGMTEDEIKRLEEEERALDAAIEQAGRRK